MWQWNRRDILRYGAVAVAGSLCRSGSKLLAEQKPKSRSLAAIVTIYTPNSHADVILTKILEGWKHDGKEGPALKLTSLYVDQFPNRDMAREMSKKHGIPIFDSIDKALTVGGKSIPVDGVLSIGEHGNYPINKLGQQLYPRKRFFQAITDAFEKYGRVVPRVQRQAPQHRVGGREMDVRPGADAEGAAYGRLVFARDMAASTGRCQTRCTNP